MSLPELPPLPKPEPLTDGDIELCYRAGVASGKPAGELLAVAAMAKSAESLRAYGAACYRAGLERAAQLADSFVASGPVSEVQQRHNWAYMHVCDAIRALIQQEGKQ